MSRPDPEFTLCVEVRTQAPSLEEARARFDRAVEQTLLDAGFDALDHVGYGEQRYCPHCNCWEPADLMCRPDGTSAPLPEWLS